MLCCRTRPCSQRGSLCSRGKLIFKRQILLDFESDQAGCIRVKHFQVLCHVCNRCKVPSCPVHFYPMPFVLNRTELRNDAAMRTRAIDNGQRRDVCCRRYNHRHPVLANLHEQLLHNRQVQPRQVPCRRDLQSTRQVCDA